MYRGAATKMAVLGIALLAAVGLLYVNRSQALIDDTAFLKSMIPHHSIAINNARKADIRDPRVRELADQTIKSQVREIAEMKALLADLERSGRRGITTLPAVLTEVTPEMQTAVAKTVRDQ